MAEKKKNKTSSGQKKSRRIGTAIRRLSTKIKRWQRYQQEISAGSRKGSIARWNVEGLERHMTLLGKML